MDDNVIICRCQEITYGEIVKAIEDGAISVTGVKKRVGSGMAAARANTASTLLRRSFPKRPEYR